MKTFRPQSVMQKFRLQEKFINDIDGTPVRCLFNENSEMITKELFFEIFDYISLKVKTDTYSDAYRDGYNASTFQ